MLKLYKKKNLKQYIKSTCTSEIIFSSTVCAVPLPYGFLKFSFSENNLKVSLSPNLLPAAPYFHSADYKALYFIFLSLERPLVAVDGNIYCLFMSVWWD